MARTDDSGMVLTFLASALQRLPMEKRWSIARGLASHGQYRDDRVLPLMIWYGIEGAVPAQPAEALSLAVETQIPLLRQFIARRLTADIDRHGAAVNELVKTLAQQPVAQRADALRGMADALRGWRKAPEPADWKRLAASIPSDHDEAVRLTRELSLVFGDGRALDELKTVMTSDAAPVNERRAAIKALVLARADGMVPMLQKLLGNRDLAADAINGLAAFNSPDTPQMLVKQYGSFRNQAKLEAISTLVSRPAFASVLLTAIEGGQVARSDVSAFQLRQMQSLGDAAIAERVSKLWPELQQLSQEKTARIAALRSMLTEETLAKASPAHGRLLFNKSCASCHRLFGEGKQLAPDLTGAQRNNINYLLENIVDPSATVSQNFRMSIVLLNDGRVMTGIVLNRSERTFALQTATELVTIAQEDVEEIRESNLSMMPDNLLSVLSDAQTRDLIAYLMSPAQVALPDEAGR
jgi:putative heme-binding domain-containing protein